MDTDIGWDGLHKVHGALNRLQADPSGLDRARMRFGQSPPPYTSSPSGTTTRSSSPDTRTDEERTAERRHFELIRERAASLPDEQFDAEVEEERMRIWHADPRTSRMSLRIAKTGMWDAEAREVVKPRWIEQGIWKDEWTSSPWGLWKHEEPLEPESVPETDMQALASGLFASPSNQQPQQIQGDEEKAEALERRLLREREREASRPYHQFVYQISKERERIQNKSTGEEGTVARDINTTAYENVKSMWVKRGVWDNKWGLIPGMSWKHERPLEEPVYRRIIAPANTFVETCLDAVKPTVNLFGDSSPVSSNNQQNFLSQEAPSADVRSVRSENVATLRRGKRDLPRTTGQALGLGKIESPRGKPQLVEITPQITPLGPVHSSKVSKTTGRKRPGPRRPVSKRQSNPSQETRPGGVSLFSDPNIAEPAPPSAGIRRRTKKLEVPEPIKATELSDITSTEPQTIKGRLRPRQNGAGNLKPPALAKPQGISKKPPMKPSKKQPKKPRLSRTREKARK